jgi:hypothetical protein
VQPTRRKSYAAVEDGPVRQRNELDFPPQSESKLQARNASRLRNESARAEVDGVHPQQRNERTDHRQ